MSTRSLKLRRWMTGLCLAAVSLLPLTGQAAQKIILLADLNATTQQAAARGFLAALGQTFTVGQTQYPLGGGFSVDIETDLTALIAHSQDPEVLALACVTSVVCREATEMEAAKDLLVITLTATSSELGLGENLLRMAPSNATQANAIYSRLKAGIGTGRFAVVYEPDAYGADLYENFVYAYLGEVMLGNDPPHWIMGLPLHSRLNLHAAQKDVDAAKVLQILASQSLDAVVYLGNTESFLDLTDATRGGSTQAAARWYAGDAVSGLAAGKGFPQLEIISLFGSDRDEPVQYYYGYDAAEFLVKAAIVYLEQGGSERINLLESAKTVTMVGKTGSKSVDSADTEALFTVLLHQTDGTVNTTTISGKLN